MRPTKLSGCLLDKSICGAQVLLSCLASLFPLDFALVVPYSLVSFVIHLGNLFGSYFIQYFYLFAAGNLVWKRSL